MEREYMIAAGAALLFFGGYVVGHDHATKRHRRIIEKQFKMVSNAYTSVLVDTYTHRLNEEQVLARLQEELEFMKIVAK